MASWNKLAKYATTITDDNGDTVIIYHSTEIVRFNAQRITLNNGGWNTVTTARKMNQAAQQFNLGYSVRLTGGKRYRGSNNLLYKERNPTGARMIATYGDDTRTIGSAPITFIRTRNAACVYCRSSGALPNHLPCPYCSGGNGK